jgi:phage terminase small subunit
MPSPRPTPVRLNLLRGNPGKRRIGNVFEPPKPPEPPDPPPFLTGYALEEWRRVAPGLSLFGLLHDFDVMPLAAYCQARSLADGGGAAGGDGGGRRADARASGEGLEGAAARQSAD